MVKVNQDFNSLMFCPETCPFCYLQQHYPYFRQPWEILSCLATGSNWLKINFPEGFSLVARLDSVNTDITTGYAKRDNLTITCNGKVLQTKEQAQSCLNNWVQVKLPNQITLRLNLTHFDDNYFGGSFATNDLLALSERVTDIQCSSQPL